MCDAFAQLNHDIILYLPKFNTDTKYNENHSKGDISKEAVLDHIYNWAMQWLANDKQNIETSKVLSIPPSPTNKDDVNNNNKDDKKTHGNNDDDGLIENNALETYEKQINASQDLYNRLRADIKQQKASVDDDFDDEQDNNNDDIRDTSLKNNNSEEEDGQYVIDTLDSMSRCRHYPNHLQ